MESSQGTVAECDVPEMSQKLLPIEDKFAESPLPANSPNDSMDSPNTVDQSSSSENVVSQDAIAVTETGSPVSSDNSMPPLPPVPKDNIEQEPPAHADYNMQNYSNYNYMYSNYNNYYGYPYPQYQWDYNSQQYFQPYQNYYNYNYNANQAQTASSKPPPPPSNAVQLPVEEKPNNKMNVSTVDDSNRYSPTAETDDDDTMKGWSENNTSDGLIEQTTPVTTSHAICVPTQSVPSEIIEPKMLENIENKVFQPVVPIITQMQPQMVVPVVTQIQPYIIPVQQSNYLINPQAIQQIQPAESTPNGLINQQQNGKDNSTDKLSKGSSVLGKNQAKKRLMAFSMMKQKLQEQNNSINDHQNSDVGEGNDVEFVPELNVFQTVVKKKVVTNKKATKVIKAQQTIEQIEEMKKDELLQGNNAALYQQLLRNGGNEAPILQKLGIESLAEKYSAKIREQDKRLKRHHHRRRDDNRRGHKYRRYSHSKSRSRSKSTEKPTMRALDVKSWKDFIIGGFRFDKFRRYKLDEFEEMKGKERKSRTKKRHSLSRSDGKNQTTDSNIVLTLPEPKYTTIHDDNAFNIEQFQGFTNVDKTAVNDKIFPHPTETEKEKSDQNFCFNLLERKKEIMKSFEVISLDGDYTKDFPISIVRHTKTKPFLKYSENPAKSTCNLQNRQQMLATLLPEIEAIVFKFLSSIKPKKLKNNHTEVDSNSIDEKLLAMMNDKNIYPFKGWWPKLSFIVTQVKEDPNVEIDKDAVIITTSKRIKKSRFNDDTTLVDLRPTVPSKWDSDYDGSPVADKVVEDIDVPQNIEINTNDDVIMVVREEENLPDVGHQEEVMDTTSDIGDVESKIEVNVSQVLPILSHEPQEVSKLNTEYVEFLKIVSAEKVDENITDDISYTNVTTTATTVEIENQNNLSTKLDLFKCESALDKSEEDTSNKSSDEYVSLHSVTHRPSDLSFVKNLTSIDKKLKKKKKPLHKKSKKNKKKVIKKKKYSKSSSSESTLDSESESDSSSDYESETSNSSSSVEKNKKKKKSKDKKKRKDKTNCNKKHKSDKNKIKQFENEKDSNSSILNLLEKAFNVEIKKRSFSDSEEPNLKKKKRKYNKKEDNLNENNDNKLEIVKECLKETFTKLVKTDKDYKNVSCDESTVDEVLKYLNMDKEKEKKNKKSKKSSKRKYDSDISDHDITPKLSKLNNSLKFENGEKKKKSSKKKTEKKSVGNNISKKKPKKKSKQTSDSSETEDEYDYKHKKIHDDEIENFFGQRPNEWNKNKSSMRGVDKHSDSKTNDKSFCQLDDNVKINSDPSYVVEVNACSSKGDKNKKGGKSKKSEKIKIKNKDVLSIDIIEEGNKLENDTGKSSETSDNSNIDNNISENNAVGKIEKINLGKTELGDEEDIVNTENEKISNTISDQSDTNLLRHEDDIPEKMLPTEYYYNEQNDRNEDLNNDSILTISKPFEQNDKPITIISPIISSGGNMSYRDKVKSNLKKLSTCQFIPFVFGLSPPLSLIKSKKLTFEKNKSFRAIKEIKPKVDSELLNFVDTAKVVISNEAKIDMNLIHDTDSHLSSSTIANVRNLSNEGKSEQIESSLLGHDSSDTNDDEYPQCETLSNDFERKELEQSNTIESNSSSDKENIQNIFSKHENIIAGEETTTFLHLSGSSESEQNVEDSLDSMTFQNKCNALSNIDSKLVEMTQSLEINFSDCNSSTNQEYDQIDHDLISQWMSDWSKIVAAKTNISNSYISDTSTVDYQRKKKSRWDKPPNNEQKDYNDIISTNFQNENSSTNADYLEEQNFANEIPLINSVNQRYDYSECWSNEYADHSQPYHEYSEINSVYNDEVNPTDYSVYEKYYDLRYDDHNEHVNTTDQSTIYETSIHRVTNLLEIPITNNESFDSLDNDETEFTNDKDKLDNNIAAIESIEDELAETKNSEKLRRDEEFSKLFHQHFEHYNQNPIKYSLSDPVLGHVTNVNVTAPETLTIQDNSDSDNNEDKTPIPARERAYSCVIQDHNIRIYLTNDNYIAYCAIEDKCMVHIAVHTSYYMGMDDEVRHCFNINQNGTTIEYWLHANLIPFSLPSDAKSKLFSDEEEVTVGTDSCQNNNVVSDNVSNDEILQNKWEIVKTDEDCWLNNSRIINKYGYSGGIDQKITDAMMSSSSELDSYESDSSDSCVDTSIENQNIAASPISESPTYKDNQNTSHSIATDTRTAEYEQAENVATCSVVTIKKEFDEYETPTDQLKVENENYHTNEITMEEDLITETKIENNEKSSIESEKNGEDNEQTLDVPPNKEIQIEELMRIKTIVNQQKLIQKLKMRSKEKIQEKLPNTKLVSYSDNMEIIKYPFLGLFQPPTFSILSKVRNANNTSDFDSPKHVTFADGINPGDDNAASVTPDGINRPSSPPPLKRLIRESLKLKRNINPFRRQKTRINVKMLNKKIATVIPLVKDPMSTSIVEYYISRRHFGHLPIVEVAKNVVESDNLRISDNNHDRTHERTLLRLQTTTREITPVPSDNEDWSDNKI